MSRIDMTGHITFGEAQERRIDEVNDLAKGVKRQYIGEAIEAADYLRAKYNADPGNKMVEALELSMALLLLSPEEYAKKTQTMRDDRDTAAKNYQIWLEKKREREKAEEQAAYEAEKGMVAHPQPRQHVI